MSQANHNNINISVASEVLFFWYGRTMLWFLCDNPGDSHNTPHSQQQFAMCVLCAHVMRYRGFYLCNHNDLASNKQRTKRSSRDQVMNLIIFDERETSNHHWVALDTFSLIKPQFLEIILLIQHIGNCDTINVNKWNTSYYLYIFHWYCCHNKMEKKVNLNVRMSASTHQCTNIGRPHRNRCLLFVLNTQSLVYL